jgi:hypothetical protein
MSCVALHWSDVIGVVWNVNVNNGMVWYGGGGVVVYIIE